MSMQVHLYAMREDHKSKAYATIYRNCVEQGVEVPDEVAEFFGYAEPPKDETAAVSLYCSPAVVRWSDSKEARDYHEIDLSKVPPGTKRIRVCVSF